MTAAKRESVLVVAAFVAAAIVLTLPLALNLRRALPSDHSDTLLISWIVGWDADARVTAARSVDAPIFFRAASAAFSEHAGLAVVPGWITAIPC